MPRRDVEAAAFPPPPVSSRLGQHQRLSFPLPFPGPFRGPWPCPLRAAVSRTHHAASSRSTKTPRPTPPRSPPQSSDGRRERKSTIIYHTDRPHAPFPKIVVCSPCRQPKASISGRCPAVKTRTHARAPHPPQATSSQASRCPPETFRRWRTVRTRCVGMASTHYGRTTTRVETGRRINRTRWSREQQLPEPQQMV